MRIEISYRPELGDGKAAKTLSGLEDDLRSRISGVRVIDVYLVNIDAPELLDSVAELFSDTVSQQTAVISSSSQQGLLFGEWGSHALPGWNFAVETGYKAGVTDPVAITAREAILLEFRGRSGINPDTLVVQTATLAAFALRSGADDEETISRIKNRLFNPLIQQSLSIRRTDGATAAGFPLLYPGVDESPVPDTELIDIAVMDDRQLLTLSSDRLLALNLEEMKAIRDLFRHKDFLNSRKSAGLDSRICDVELEMLAQTWSEHCKHKIFQAEISYDDGEGNTVVIDGLFKNYIKATTDRLSEGRQDLRSVFHDDSGVVDFDDDHVICFKAETHNSPSALDPYGGAITGIVGVNRDIMGTGKGARPIFNTNVLCFGHPDTDANDIPEGLLHPRSVMHGVHEGIIDGGNQSGIPTVAGAFLFDESYLGKPLVFCGTGGIMPRFIHGEESWIQHIEPGDKAVMLGGRIGKDGIHGATFSSLALDEDSPTSAVQIGDPITQRKMLDFLQEARDAGLYRGITDNGAGGLSSSLGEMAEFSNGIAVYLDKAPLKYRGLAAWEIWVSESQERMSLAVEPRRLDEFMNLARRRGVEASVLGEFRDTGLVELFYNDSPVGRLPLEFVHDGVPRMKLQARWEAAGYRRPRDEAGQYRLAAAARWNDSGFIATRLLELLSEPNIRSKESLVRQYDHEVQGQSVVKPFTGVRADAPSDGAVLRPVPKSSRGISVTHGICPRMSDEDAYQMAAHAVDEAYRAHIALGGHPDRASGLDNFCWPDPVRSDYTPDGEYKLAQLVRANRGLQDSCLAYNLPLISGKDSMKNDAVLGGKKVSVRPTLLVSLMGIVGDVAKVPDQGIYEAGLLLYLLGPVETRTGGSFFEKLEGRQLGPCPEITLEANRRRYLTLHGLIGRGEIQMVHDVSDGGLLTALAESCLAGRIGANIDISRLADREISPVSASEILFAEGGGRFILAVKADTREALESAFVKEELHFLGTSGGKTLNLALGSERKAHIGLEDISGAFIREW